MSNYCSSASLRSKSLLAPVAVSLTLGDASGSAGAS